MESVWLPASLLLQENQQSSSCRRIVRSEPAKKRIQLHINKGLAGAPPEQNALARRCATNPAVADAFCLAIVATGGPPPFPGLPGPQPDMAAGPSQCAQCRQGGGGR